ncbi:MAG: CorA family divalent cation transporter [Acidimicrobiia bacterium]
MEIFRYQAGSTEPDVISVEQLPAALKDESGFVWIHAVALTGSEIAALSPVLALPIDVIEHLEEQEHRVKLVHYGEVFHVSVRDMHLHGDELDVSDIDVALGTRWILTHQDELRPGRISIDDVKIRMQSERNTSQVHGIALVFWALLDSIVDRYFLVTEAVDERIDLIEEVVFSDAHETAIPKESYKLRRSLVRFRRSSVPLREVIGAVLRHEVAVFDADAVPLFQDVQDHVMRIGDLVESQREVLTGLLEAHLAIVSNNMNQVMKATSSWGAILLVSTLIAGIYGMNFRHMPELAWGLGYPLALAIMALLTFLLYRMFKKRDWL